MTLPLEVPEEYQHPEWTGDPIEVVENIGLKFDPAVVNNWTVKLFFNKDASGSGFFVHIPGAQHDVILTAAHNLIMGGKKTTDMKVHIGKTDLLPKDKGGLGLGGSGAGVTGSGTSSTGGGNDVKAVIVSVPDANYRISKVYEADESKKEADFGAILLPLDTFSKLQMGYGFGYSLRLAEEDYLKGEMRVTGYGKPAHPGAPIEATGRFINCRKKQLEYNAFTEPGVSGSVVWMEYDGGPVAVGIHNYGGDDTKKTAGTNNRKNKGSRVTLDVMREVFAWPGIEVGRLNHQLKATGNEKSLPSSQKRLPPNGLFLYFDEGWDFARVKRGSGSRFDVYPVQSNSCLDSINRKWWIGMILKDSWAIQGKPKWVYFRQGAIPEVRWTESMRNDCLLEELPISTGSSSESKLLVRRIPDPNKPNAKIPAFALVMQGNDIDDNDVDGESSEALVVKHPSGPKTQYKELLFVP